MPKTITTTVYTYEELTTEKAKEKALSWLREGCYDDIWWENIYEGARRAGLKIKTFNMDSYGNVNDVDGEFIVSALECSELILADHGKECATYKTAQAYEAAIDALPELPEEDAPNYREIERELCEGADAIEGAFTIALLNDYKKMLQDEYEHYYSDEHLIELMEGNDYTFTKDGKRFG